MGLCFLFFLKLTFWTLSGESFGFCSSFHLCLPAERENNHHFLLFSKKILSNLNSGHLKVFLKKYKEIQ